MNSNYKYIFHKCSLACSFALEKLSTHMQTHILDPSHFPSLIPVTALLSFAREREREREREIQDTVSVWTEQLKETNSRSQKNGAFNNVVLLFSQCNKRTYIIILSNTVPKKAALVYCSPLPGLCLLKCKDCQVVWNLA